jgi:hypothetical protein
MSAKGAPFLNAPGLRWMLRGNQDENSASIWMRRPAVLERGRA